MPCYSFPCVYGTCVNTPATSAYTCVCKAGFTGVQCDRPIDLCTSGISNQPTCLNNGKCMSSISSSFTCICNNLFTGQRCEAPKDPCESYPCQRGLCASTPLAQSGYKCQCPNGFTGLYCEADVNECTAAVNSENLFYF